MRKPPSTSKFIYWKIYAAGGTAPQYMCMYVCTYGLPTWRIECWTLNLYVQEKEQKVWNRVTGDGILPDVNRKKFLRCKGHCAIRITIDLICVSGDYENICVLRMEYDFPLEIYTFNVSLNLNTYIYATRCTNWLVILNDE